MPERRAYLLDVTDRRPNERLLETLVDILARYAYNELFLFSRRPAEGERILSGRIRAYGEIQGVTCAVLDAGAYDALVRDGRTVCAPTCAGRSLCGRMEEMRRGMERAEEAVRARKARRFLVTDFSDGKMWHPFCVSLPGIVLGGSLMTGGAKAARADLEKELCSVMDLPAAGLLQKLGTLYLRGGAVRTETSEFFNILAGDCGYSRHPGLTQAILDEVSAVCRGVRIQLERWTERNDWAKEIAYAANLLDCACHRRDEAMLRALRDEHGRLWRLRHEPEGRIESLAQLPRF